MLIRLNPPGMVYFQANNESESQEHTQEEIHEVAEVAPIPVVPKNDAVIEVTAPAPAAEVKKEAPTIVAGPVPINTTLTYLVQVTQEDFEEDRSPLIKAEKTRMESHMASFENQVVVAPSVTRKILDSSQIVDDADFADAIEDEKARIALIMTIGRKSSISGISESVVPTAATAAEVVVA